MNKRFLFITVVVVSLLAIFLILGNRVRNAPINLSYELKNEVPLMGGWKRYNLPNVNELSGLCISHDGSHLWGVGDEGTIYNISYAGIAKIHWHNDSDMEGITLNPVNGDMYLAIEGEQKISLVPAPAYNNCHDLWYVQEAVDENYDNSGLEGITWYKENQLYIGSQTDAKLWTYNLDGTLNSVKSLMDIVPEITEIADLWYDSVYDMLWVIDSNLYKMFLFDGAATRYIASYDISKLTQDNPESVCVDHNNNCVWIADDADESILYKIEFIWR